MQATILPPAMPGQRREREIRVLIVEDHRVLAESLAALMERDAALEVTGIALTAGEAVALARADRPDVVLMDLRLPDGSGADAAAQIRAERTAEAIIFLTGDESEAALAAAVEAGAAGFLAKSEALENVVDAIKRAGRGEMLIQPRDVQRAFAELRARRRAAHEREQVLSSLTAREREILALLSEGGDVPGIARRLSIAPLTVRTHVRSVLAKLESHSQLQAVARARALGIIDAAD